MGPIKTSYVFKELVKTRGYGNVYIFVFLRKQYKQIETPGKNGKCTIRS